MCEQGQFVPIAEAARMLETTETRVFMMLKNSEIKGVETDEGWMVEKISLNLCGKPKAETVIRSGGCGGGCGGGCKGG